MCTRDSFVAGDFGSSFAGESSFAGGARLELRLEPNGFDRKRLASLTKALPKPLREFILVARQLIARGFTTELRNLELDLAGCTSIEDGGIRSLAKAFPLTLVRLSMTLSGMPNASLPMRITDDALLGVARALPGTLTELHLRLDSCVQITDEGVRSLAGRLPISLNHVLLSFVGCVNISNASLFAIAEKLPQTIVNLELCFFGCLQVDDHGMASIADVLPPSLRSLRLDFRACKISDKGLAILARSLPPDLGQLDLDFRLCDVDSKVRTMTESLRSMREWQKALLVQDDALQKPTDARCAAAAARLLGHEDWLVRKIGSKTLGMLGEVSLPHALPLINMLLDAECQTWVFAAESIVRLGETTSATFLSDACRSPRAVRSSRSSINRAMVQVKAAGAASPGDLGDILAQRVAGLASRLTDTDEYVRKAAADALRQLGPVGAPHAAALAGVLMDDDEDVREAALRALSQLSAAAVPYVADIAELLQDDDEDVRMAAARALGTLGSVAEPHADVLAAQLSDPDKKEGALQLLGAMGAAAGAHAEAIAYCLRDEDWRIRIAATEALGQLGAAANPYVGRLTRLLHDEDHIQAALIHVDVGRDVRSAAANALVRLPAGAVLPHTLAYIALSASSRGEGHEELRRRADDALWGLGDEQQVVAFIGVLNDENWQMRVAAVGAIADLGAATVVAVAGVLAKKLEDCSIAVREAAALALGKLPDAALSAKEWAFAAAAPHGDQTLRWRAREALACFGSEQHAEALASWLEHDNALVRRGAVEALAALGAVAALHALALARLLMDKGKGVRAAATAAFEMLVESPAPPPAVAGHLWKKSPSLLRLGTYQWRFVKIAEGRMAWWSSQEAAPADPSDMADCSGCVDLREGACEAVLVPSSDKDQQQFVLRPVTGTALDGTFTGAGMDREFGFDATSSEYCAEAWVYLLRMSMQPAHDAASEEDSLSGSGSEVL
eukprot:TRINITY_DN41988_c0_g1_i2.p1 TRINITY_DN41988_c0_g1~~TRINITY_DN41988_c0_g1_i2.p1  ORF type:complete len:962 (-),score=188.55 TRINITY_DN41988_c0_g1_i2:112-2997(-)